MDRSAGYTHQIECLDDTGLQQLFSDNNLVYAAGYQVLRALFDLGKSTLEKIDQRRAGIHEMTESLRSVLGRLTCNPADPDNYPFV